MEYLLPDLNLLEVKSSVSDDEKSGVFQLEPLSPGYGVTVGNTLRRILLSSLEGAAVRSVKISGCDHEYSTIKGIKEDVVDIILNLKTLRLRINGEGPYKLELSVKGPKKVTAADFKKSSDVDVMDSDHYIATIEKGAKLEFEIMVGRGRGYEPVEKRSEEKLPIGTIMIDSIFTPVKKVRYDVENTRVGGDTNYNKLTMEITTDGSILPSDALKTAATIMAEHLQVICGSCEALSIASKPKAKKKAISKEKPKTKKKSKK